MKNINYMIKIYNKNLVRAYLGNQEISKIYKGNDLIFDKNGHIFKKYPDDYFVIQGRYDSNINNNSTYCVGGDYSNGPINGNYSEYECFSNDYIDFGTQYKINKLYFLGTGTIHNLRIRLNDYIKHTILDKYNPDSNTDYTGLNGESVGGFSDFRTDYLYIENEYYLSKITDMRFFFKNNKTLINIYYDADWITEVTNLYCCFYNCESLIWAPCYNWDTSNCKNYSYMFYNCKSLKSANTKYFTNETEWGDINCDYMFYGCESLEEIDLSNLDVDRASNNYMFYGCKNLKTVHLYAQGGQDFSCDTQMFGNCPNLERIYVHGNSYMDYELSQNVPSNVEIIVI